MTDFLNDSFSHIRKLAKDFDAKLNGTSSSDQLLSNELAGMFAVTIAATYEGIVKETVINYAGNFHVKYRDYIENDFDRINARISFDDLGAYSRRFGLNQWIGEDAKKNSTTFHKVLSYQRNIVERRFRVDLKVSYSNILKWRNAYAHERTTSATFKDVYNAHRVAQYVIRAFVKSFEIG